METRARFERESPLALLPVHFRSSLDGRTGRSARARRRDLRLVLARHASSLAATSRKARHFAPDGARESMRTQPDTLSAPRRKPTAFSSQAAWVRLRSTRSRGRRWRPETRHPSEPAHASDSSAELPPDHAIPQAKQTRTRNHSSSDNPQALGCRSRSPAPARTATARARQFKKPLIRQ